MVIVAHLHCTGRETASQVLHAQHEVQIDEAFARAWREDADLRFRLAAEAGPAGRGEGAVVLHPVRPERWGISLRHRQNVVFDALRYREAMRRITPWDGHLIVAASAGAAGLGLAGRPVGAALTPVLSVWWRLRGAWHFRVAFL